MTDIVKIYHNPRCSKSRETLRLLEERGIVPEITLYLETPPDKASLIRLLNALDFTSARQLMRTKETLYNALNLDNEALSQDHLLQAMVEHPSLIERPIVVYRNKARIGRPPEKALEILD